MSPDSILLITTLLLLFGSSLAGGLVAKRLKLPLLVGYIAGGVIFGNVFPLLASHEFLTIIADAGVTLLLFTLGIEFSFHRLRKSFATIGWMAGAQIIISILVFLGVFLVFRFSFLTALFLATATALSSTAIAVKVLAERGELETHHGELTTTWLVIQDLSVVPLMLIIPAISRANTAQAWDLGAMVFALATSLALSFVVLLSFLFLGRLLIPRVLTIVSGVGSREILLVSVVGLVFLSASGSYALGLSAPLGAFLAGLLVAQTSQNHAIFAEIRPLRDLFSVVFFSALGLVLPMQAVLSQWPRIVAIAFVVLCLRWIIVWSLARVRELHRKTAFFIALSLLPMSEFGFVIAGEGRKLQGGLGSQDYILLVAVTFITICVGGPLMAGGNKLYYWFYHSVAQKVPLLFPVSDTEPFKKEGLPIKDHVVVCGYGRVGKYIGRALEMAGIPFLVIDYNMTTVASLRSRGISVVYGDPADREVLDYAQVDYAKALIVAIPDRHTQEMVITQAQTLNRRIKIICRTHREEDQKHLKSLGVTTVIQPEFEAALSIVIRLLSDFGKKEEDIAGKISRLKIEHGLG